MPHLEALQNNSELQSQYHGRLVQVRALVVETLDPEIYPGVVQEQDGLWSCGKYGYDVPSLENGTAKNLSYWERQPVAVKPIPGLSTWCNTYMTSGMFCSAPLLLSFTVRSLMPTECLTFCRNVS